MDDSISILRDALIGLLSGGFDADRGAFDFARSSLGIDSPEEFAAALVSDEGAPLVSLIVHPDRRAREFVEPHVPVTGLTAEQEDLLIREAAAAAPLEIRAGNSIALITPGIEETERYVRSLRLRYPLPGVLSAEGECRDAVIAARVIVRVSGYAGSPVRDQFLAHLASGARGNIDGMLVLLRAALKAFSLYEDGSEADSAFLRRRNALAERQSEIVKFDELLMKHGMELLLMRRITPPPESREEVEREMVLMDRLREIAGGIHPFSTR